MENKFKVGDRVKISFSDEIYFGSEYQGKKGVITKLSSWNHEGLYDTATVLLKDFPGEDCDDFDLYDLKLRKPKRHKFDLDRALAGEALVTRDGVDVTDVEPHHHCDYVICARPEGDIQRSYSAKGRAVMGMKYPFDLFMKHPAKESKPVTDLPQYTAELLSQAVPNPVSDGIDKLKEQLTPGFVDMFNKMEVEPKKDYGQLKRTFEKLLNLHIIRCIEKGLPLGVSAKDFKAECDTNWKKAAGL